MIDLPPYLRFSIQIYHDWKTYHYLVQRTWHDSKRERFTLYAKNKVLVFENLRPYFRNRGLKHRRIEWKLVEGTCWNTSFLDKIVKAMTDYIVWVEGSTPGYVHPKNEKG